MRVLRVVVGILTLLLAIAVLIAGSVAWWVMQHRSPDGAFHADLTAIQSPGRVIVVPDVDAILRRDAPIARADHTTLRIKTEGFIGMADPADVAAYLAGVDYTEVRKVALGRGALPVDIQQVTSSGDRLADPEEQDFWYRSGLGELAWSPAIDRGEQVSLVIVAAPPPRADSPPSQAAAVTKPVRVSVALTAGWLNSTTWGLLILGPVLLLLGLAALAWPQRPREIVYVMDSAAAVRAGLPAHPGLHPAVNATYPPARRYTTPMQAAAPAAELGWPPPEPTTTTSPPLALAAEPPTGDDPAPAADLPMPIVGAHLHLRSTKEPNADTVAS